MKKLLFTGIFALSLFFCICVYAGSLSSDVVVGIQERSVPECDEFTVTGGMPFISITGSGTVYDNLQTEINAEIERKINGKIENGKNNRARSMAFSYDCETGGNIVSIIIYTSASLPGHTRQEVNSVNFDKSSGQFVNINTILGPNGVKLMNTYLNSLVRTDPSKYNLSFSGITENHDFYTDGVSLFLFFGSYEITKGNSEAETVEIPLSLIKSYCIQVQERKSPSANLTILLPLREICQFFGYDVSWRDFDMPIVISRNTFQTEITTNLNEYKKGPLSVKLEAPPIFIDGTTFVPITFFEEILGLTYYVGPDSFVTVSEISLPVAY